MVQRLPPARIVRHRAAVDVPQRRVGIPLLPLLSACLLLLALVQVGIWLWSPREQNVLRPLFAWWEGLKIPAGEMPAIAQAKRPAVVENFGAELPVIPAREVGLRRVLLPTEPENIQFGEANAAVVLTLLSDPLCGECRAAVRRWQVAAAGGKYPVRVVFKFWPRDMARTTGGLALELARKQGKVAPFWQALEKKEGDLSEEQVLVLLEQAGVPLSVQREALSAMTKQAKLPDVLERDMAQIEPLELGRPPLALLNGYVLDERWMAPEAMAQAVGRLARGQALGDGLWLMER